MKRSELFFTFILLPVDIVMIVAAFVAAYWLRGHLENVPLFFHSGVIEYLKYSFYLMPAWLVIFALSGLYATGIGRGYLNTVYRIFISNSVAILFLVLALFFSKTTFFSRIILLLTWIFSIILVSLGRLIIRLIRRKLLKYGIGIRKVLFIGSNETTMFVVNEIRKNPAMGLKVIGVLNGEKDHPSDLKQVGTVEDLNEVIGKYQIDEVVLAEERISKSRVLSIIKTCADRNVTFKFIPEIISYISLRVQTETIGSMPILKVQTVVLDGWGRISKRVADFLCALIFLIITSPFSLIISIIQKLTSKGPVIYSHDRVGRDGKVIKIYKFRSMYVDAEKHGKFWTEKDDPRITPFGKFLRKTNLDEIPQFWNILIGNMSLVGPRPEQPRFVEQFEKEVPGYFSRHRVKSGLTGWAQVNGLKGDTSIAERVRYDTFYIENWSPWFDLKIIIRTIWIIIYEVLVGKYEYRSDS